MSNAAYTESYLAFRQRCLAAFTLENRVERAGLRPVEQQFEEFTLRRFLRGDAAKLCRPRQ